MKALGTIRIAAALLAGSTLTLMACAGSDDEAGTDEPAGDGQVLSISSNDALEFDPSSLTATSGEITIEHQNEGSVVHSFVITEADLRLVNDDEATIELGAGEYVYFCDVPGHREAGMEGTLTVDG